MSSFTACLPAEGYRWAGQHEPRNVPDVLPKSAAARTRPIALVGRRQPRASGPLDRVQTDLQTRHFETRCIERDSARLTSLCR